MTAPGASLGLLSGIAGAAAMGLAYQFRSKSELLTAADSEFEWGISFICFTVSWIAAVINSNLFFLHGTQ